MKSSTFKVEEDVGLVVFEHLSYELRVHVLDVDFLQILVQHHNGLIKFLLIYSWLLFH